MLTGAYSGIFPGWGGLNIFLYRGEGAQHLLGPENPLKSIDFFGPGGLSPYSPPLNTPLNVDTFNFMLNPLFFEYPNKITTNKSSLINISNFPASDWLSRVRLKPLYRLNYTTVFRKLTFKL